MISLLASKCQHFKLRGLQFHYIKWLKKGHSIFKVLANSKLKTILMQIWIDDKIVSNLENKNSNFNKFFLEVEKQSILVSKSETPLADF